MKEINEARKTFILGAIIAAVLVIALFMIFESFGCFGCNMCGSGDGFLRGCFDACTGCAKCVCS